MDDRRYPERPFIGVGGIVFDERIIPDEQDHILYHYVLIDYLCRLVQGRLRAGSDALEAAFYPLKDLEHLGLTPGTGPIIQKAFDLKNKIFS
jgi:8-oxo-dGTP diphosphatase